MAEQPRVIAADTSEHGIDARLYEDRVMHVVFPRGIVVDTDVARANRQLQASLTDGPYVVVADATQLAYLDRDARAFLASDERGKQVAIAVVVGRRISSYVVERWTTDHEIDRPVEMFHDPAEAFAWARARAAELIGDDDSDE